MAQNIEIFIINLARSIDRRESMRRKIAGIRGFSAIYIDGEKVGNSSLGMQFAPFPHKTAFDEHQVLSHLFHAKTAQSHTAITSIVCCENCIMKCKYSPSLCGGG